MSPGFQYILSYKCLVKSILIEFQLGLTVEQKVRHRSKVLVDDSRCSAAILATLRKAEGDQTSVKINGDVVKPRLQCDKGTDQHDRRRN